MNCKLNVEIVRCHHNKTVQHQECDQTCGIYPKNISLHLITEKIQPEISSITFKIMNVVIKELFGQ